MEITMVFSICFVREGSMIDLGVGNLQLVHTPALFQSNSSIQKWVEKLLAKADVEVQGSRPWDIRVHHKAFWNRIVMHTLGNDTSVNNNEPWLSKYIFRGSVISSPAQLGKAMDDLFVLEDWHNFGFDYDRTLMAWNENFHKAWPRFEDQYGKRFFRMWRYYLLSCAGGARSRYTQLFQVVLSKGGLRGGWRAVR